jgi:acyl transferase domain-containing protein/acyl carrier protein
VCGFLEEGDGFDAGFFNMNETEAKLTDPQHRILLECAWEAMEAAGYNPYTYPGRIACLAGVGMSLYAGRRYDSYLTTNLLSQPAQLDEFVAPQITLANRADYTSTRIAYFMDLRGPCLNIQTACSTGLSAVHMARKSLLAGECDMALAGAAAVQVPLKRGYIYEGGLLSPDGSCRPFDIDACGTVGGSGVGMVVLRRLEDALDCGDPILAVILGSAMNNDGNRKVSFLAPGVDGQIQAICAALQDAGIDPATIGYVETHGTGTPLGDPIELASLTESYRKWTDKKSYCALGSVKANIGHLDTAAGIIGFIKAVLAVQRGVIPQLSGFHKANPKLILEESPFWIPTETCSWSDPPNSPRRAAVSSLGAGGTNVHMLLERPPAPRTAVAFSAEAEWPGPEILPLSARTPAALNALFGRYEEYLGRGDAASWPDIAYTAAVGREHFGVRAAVIAESAAEASTICASRPGETEASSPSAMARKGPGAKPVIAFLFPGQGNLDLTVIRQLYAEGPAFRKRFDECSEIYRHLQKTPLTDLLNGGSAEILQHAEIVQPMVFAMAVSMAALWNSRGVSPSAAAGHSIGEYAAAHICGILNLETAMRLVEARGRLMTLHCPAGAMVALHASAEAVEKLLQQCNQTEHLVVAVTNAPEATVVAGPPEECDYLVQLARKLRLRPATLAVTHAFHSPLIEPMLKPFREILDTARFSRPTIRFVSSVAGGRADVCTVDYWLDQLRKPVQFQAALEQLGASGHGILLEMGTDAVLSSFAHATFTDCKVEALASVRPGRMRRQLAETTATLYAQGVEIFWPGVYAGRKLRRTQLPTYPFERRRDWINAVARNNSSALPETRSTSPQVWDLRWEKKRLAADSKEHAQEWLLIPSDYRFSLELQKALRARGITSRIYTGKISDFCQWIREQGDKSHRLLFCCVGDENRYCGPAAPFTEISNLCALVRELSSVRLARCELLLVTRGGQAAPTVADVGVYSARAALWGFGRTIRRELPDLRVQCMDVSGHQDEAANQIALEVACGCPDEEVAWRSGERFVPVLVQADEMKIGSAALRLDREALYLVTGGFGGLGIHVATCLVQRGARRLALVGRRGPTERAMPYLKSMQALGARISCVNADVATEEGLEKMLHTVQQQAKSTLRGIVHAAGLIRDAVLPQLGENAIVEVLRPKMHGAWNLDRLSQGCDLDFFVAFSSAAALIGSSGQANYAAANAAMDMAVEQRRAHGLPGLSLRWGPWAEAGMAARQSASQARRFGFDPIQLKDGLAIFETLLGQDLVDRPLVARPAPYLSQTISTSVALSDFSRLVWDASDPTHSAPAVGHDARHTHSRNGASPKKNVLEAVLQEVANVAQLNAGVIDPERGLIDQGIDSLRALQLRVQLNREFHISLPPTAVFTYPTPCRLAEAILAELANKDYAIAQPNLT